MREGERGLLNVQKSSVGNGLGGKHITNNIYVFDECHVIHAIHSFRVMNRQVLTEDCFERGRMMNSLFAQVFCMYQHNQLTIQWTEKLNHPPSSHLQCICDRRNAEPGLCHSRKPCGYSARLLGCREPTHQE